MDLFTGVAGFSLGFKWSSGRFRTVFYCEINKTRADKYIIEFQRGNLDASPVWNDIATLDTRIVPPCVDVVTAGFPCTDISNAGKREGIEGAQSNLYTETLRIASDIRPRFVVLENVTAILSRGILDVLRDLAKIGYHGEVEAIPASIFGAPQNRDRAWVIAYPTSFRQDSNEVFNKINYQECGKKETGQGEWNGKIWPKGNRDFLYSHWKETFKQFCALDNGIPRDLDEFEGYGNAIVPHVAEYIGKQLLRYF